MGFVDDVFLYFYVKGKKEKREKVEKAPFFNFWNITE
jgi:hypothetical protein